MIYLILLIGLILRVIHINQSLWLDEAIGAIAAKDFSYTGILFDFLRADNHPPLYYLTLKFWSSIFGYSEISLRSLSILFGLLTIYFTYLIAKKIWNNQKFILFSTIFIATAPLHIYYSQEVRMYPMITLLSAVLIYIFLQLETSTKKLWLWAFFSSLLFLTLASDYITVFLFPIFFIYSFINRKKLNWFINLFLSFIPTVIGFTWWLPMFLIQVQGGQVVTTVLPAWRDLAGGATLKQAILFWNKFVLGRISLENKVTYYGLLGIFSIPIAVSLLIALKNFKKIILIWLWFIIPSALGFLASYFIPAFNYFRFIYLLPAFYLLIAWGIFQIKNTLFQKILVALILLTNITGVSIYYFDNNQLREDWKTAIKLLEEKSKENEIAIFEFPDPFAPVRWYSTGKTPIIGATDRISVDPEKTKAITSNAIKNKTGIYYFDYLKDLSDPDSIVQKTLEENNFKKIEVTNFRNIGQMSYYVKQ